MSPETMQSMKLSRFISLSGLGSRRKAETIISEGRVTVNGEVVTNVATRICAESDVVQIDGSGISLPFGNTYMILNKPRGYVCSTMAAGKYRTIYALVPGGGASHLKYAGRLDVDSEGLVLLTDDGELINRLTHPRYRHGKVYLVKTIGVPDRKALRTLETGIHLDDGLTAPCSVKLIRRLRSGAWLRIEIFEGRKRQLRRMFEAVGYKVERLKRVSLGTLRMGSLGSGEARELTRAEIERLKKSAGLD